MYLRHRLHTSSNALVTMTAAQFGQAQVVSFDQTGAGFVGSIKELPHARVAACGFVLNFDDGLRRSFQTYAHGMKAE
jgi:hypothetical protein